MKSKTSRASAVIIHGHRGSRGTHPENTLPAFQEAVDAGAQVLELDLQLSADDVPVISHDSELTPQLCLDPAGRPLTQPVPIRKTKAADLVRYDCGSLPNPRFPEQKAVPRTPIPTLEQFLKWASKHAPRLEYNIETKMTAPDPALVAPPDLFARRVVDVLKRHGAVGKTILQSFDFRTLEAAKKIEPRLRLSCLFEEEKAFCEATRTAGAGYASPYFKLVTKDEVERCHRAGIQVVPWTANATDEWESLIAMGVDALITDYPRKLAVFLGRKSE